MKNTIKNKLYASLVCVGCFLSIIGITSYSSKTNARYVYTCYAENTIGMTFSWSHSNVQMLREHVMVFCQRNTPPGESCRLLECR